jgi:hypothetical protein
MSGENFKLLAKDLSDSESRHNNGFLGIVKRGDFSNEFDEVVFNLDLHTPSQVLKTKDGYHLFLVTEKLNQKKYQINEIKNIIQKEVFAELVIEKIKQQALLLPQPKPLMISDANEFTKTLKRKLPLATLYEIGEQKLNVSKFMFLLQEQTQKKPKIDIQSKAYLLFQENAYSEIIYQYMLKENIEYNQADLLSSKTAALVIDEFSKTKLKSYINKHPKLIKDYFYSNKKRYTTPRKINIQLLNIPITKGINLMPTLEASREKLDKNEITLKELANKYNGKVVISGLMETQKLAKLNKNIISFMHNLKVNQHSAPFTTNGYYNIVKLINQTTEKSNPLSIIREKVVNDYIKNYKPQIFIDMVKTYTNNLSVDEKVLELFIKESLDY